jgi:GMP synthase (glutamine-hydrolysing)
MAPVNSVTTVVSVVREFESMSIKVLLLQARNADDPMAAHEHACFVERTGLEAGQIVAHDLCQGPPRSERARMFDAVMVGGAGDYYVSKGNLPEFEAFLELLRDLIARGRPTFASCFGYQSLVRALGGEVIFDPDNTEVGTFELTLSAAGREDPLFGHLPQTFLAQMGHKDRAAVNPDGIPNLAGSERCPLQAFRIPGLPIWASQFHPELDRKTNQDRFRHYLEGYATYMSAAERQAALDGFRESPEASELLKRFLELVFG